MLQTHLKAIIFDWGRTLHNPETDSLFHDVPQTVERLARHYILAIVSLAKNESPKERKKKIQESGIAEHFKVILVGSTKDYLYERVLKELNLGPSSVAVVDDQVKRGVQWGVGRGSLTVWFRNGKFAHDLPLSDNEAPNFTITKFRQLATVFEVDKKEREGSHGKGDSAASRSVAV